MFPFPSPIEMASFGLVGRNTTTNKLCLDSLYQLLRKQIIYGTCTLQVVSNKFELNGFQKNGCFVVKKVS
jgi:hypothetical protein